MNKIVTVIGTRPQLIKYFPFSKAIEGRFTEVLIDTGQHYDSNMSEVFYQELHLKKPEYVLGVGSGNHGQQTATMLQRIEEILIHEKPEAVVVFGDTNSTLAGVLAASKLLIPVVHIEAGLRSYNKKMPEEQNRIVADHLSTLLLCPTQLALKNLKNEGIISGIEYVGDIMYDSVLKAYALTENPSEILQKFGIESGTYQVLTLHRAENTNAIERLQQIFAAIETHGVMTLFPIHPRTKKIMADQHIAVPECIQMIDPLGYLDMVVILKNARLALSDSGGLQKEAYFLGTPCLVLREETEWSELVESGNNTLVGYEYDAILKALRTFKSSSNKVDDFGDGHAASKIISAIERLLKS